VRYRLQGAEAARSRITDPNGTETVPKYSNPRFMLQKETCDPAIALAFAARSGVSNQLRRLAASALTGIEIKPAPTAK
jgi:hypothetical protein